MLNAEKKRLWGKLCSHGWCLEPSDRENLWYRESKCIGVGFDWHNRQVEFRIEEWERATLDDGSACCRMARREVIRVPFEDFESGSYSIDEEIR